MEKKIFNPLDWLEQPNQQQINTEPQKVEANTGAAEVEKIIQQIEAKQIDIATAYSDWRDIGFAFADAFGESGREYFHRISKFYADYSATECDTQFTNCLKANGHGVTLKTFFFHAKQAGLNIAVSRNTPNRKKYSYQLSLNLSILSFLSFCKRLSRLLHSTKNETFFC